jgi:hypothetical protein
MSIERKHTDYHLRSMDQQKLDALLRIEEILARAFPDPRKETTVVEPVVPKKGRFSK